MIKKPVSFFHQAVKNREAMAHIEDTYKWYPDKSGDVEIPFDHSKTIIIAMYATKNYNCPFYDHAYVIVNASRYQQQMQSMLLMDMQVNYHFLKKWNKPRDRVFSPDDFDPQKIIVQNFKEDMVNLLNERDPSQHNKTEKEILDTVNEMYRRQAETLMIGSEAQYVPFGALPENLQPVREGPDHF